MRMAKKLLLYFCLVVYARETLCTVLPSCLELGNIAWSNNMPFVSDDIISKGNNGTSAILPIIFEKALQSCCRGVVNLNYTLQFNNQNDLMDLIRNHSIHFIFPIQKDKKSKKYFHYPFISIVESPGIAIYMQKQRTTGELIVSAITSTWPLITVMFLLVIISGNIFYIVETLTLNIHGKDTSPFTKGVLEGIWWAFVSMTTVGYGDVCPKTKPGRVFSIIWVITGVASCAIFTSYITTMLTSSCMKETTLHESKVGVIGGTEELRYAMNKGYTTNEYESVDMLIEELKNKEVGSILLDTYVAGEYKNKLESFQLQGIIEHVTRNGVAFVEEGIQYASCIRDYTYSRQGEIFELISNTVKFIRVSSSSNAEEKSKNLFDPSSKGFIILVGCVAAVIVVCHIIGLSWDIQNARKKQKSNLNSFTENIMSLTEWRCKYKSEFQTILREMREDVDLVQLNCTSLITQLANQETGIVKRNGYTSQHYGDD